MSDTEFRPEKLYMPAETWDAIRGDKGSMFANYRNPAGSRGNLPPRQRTGPIGARVNANADKKAARKAKKDARRRQR